MSRFTFHHTGCVVSDIREAIEAYGPLLLSVGDVVNVSTQGVKICFAEIAPATYVEFVEPAATESKVAKLLSKRVTYYHLGFTVPNFDEALEELAASGYHLLDTFHSEAFSMRRCAFLASPVSHLIEIIEAPDLGCS